MYVSLLDMKCYSPGMGKCSLVVIAYVVDYNFASYWFVSIKAVIMFFLM
jgi:hypothetical protein